MTDASRNAVSDGSTPSTPPATTPTWARGETQTPASTLRPAYRTVHDWIRRARGAPARHLCPCGQRATEWAYVGPMPSPLIDERGCPYSANLLDYTALCRSCHLRLDRSHACPRGHLRTPETTYRRPDGRIGHCRICRRDLDRARASATIERTDE